MENKIFIYGVPGAGKTTYSIRLKNELGYPVVEADYLREIAQKEKSEAEDPFLYIGTKEAWKKFGELNEENIIKGLKAVRTSMMPYVNQEILKYPNELIMEGAFLEPQQLIGKGKLLLVVTTDEEQHRKQYFIHREHSSLHEETFTAVRIIQKYLIDETSQYSVEIIENKF
ncbi:MAG: hypothetical protein UW43_C0001G0020 [Candidatus Yanofskybacteria bacterium GW2011_GWA1_44_21]|uniref:UDP-N-acetylglucosamine kinase n=2 Tax=Candidatus Yanofskyibacteriota TaxID=1752733 RepID=A0A1F8H2E8_9BACT|nr:MAG: hypothetical protein UW14_C0006G0013 [Candidatus Yanofskybacteria bacterium GW2011_GWA2_44_10]KKT50855.1 MAG: hypothetical protein UW43_C0001G0020 [Candidatus Yanofskybacteria bacterium GW2011_GWA1_44_21]KKT90428.1 MAG: hypothetical protein UW90_C0001G0016 [Candidatus Yanofskybacteria bacterium GW2011_GWB1_45_11]OGN02274.1 MAG: hypothetical protein A2657_00805 [Candidatus Yanofskybacteria bacterium RIFCSPHIGHO2_01_FULL_44_110b]OGN14232.1 MAG: hypothetical protein A3C01_01395 [Candidatus